MSDRLAFVSDRIEAADPRRAKESMADEALFTTYSLAHYLQVSARTVQREVARGRLTYVMVGGRRRYRRHDVESYLRNRTQRSQFRIIQGGRSRFAVR